MRNIRFLPAAIVAAAVLAISRPAGVGSERAGTGQATLREPPAASTRVTALGASAETPEPSVRSGESPQCGRDFLIGIKERMPTLDTVAGTLAASGNAEHLLAAAVLRLGSDAKRALDLLTRAGQANPAHPLIAMRRLDACMSHPDLETCATHDVEANAIRIEGTNGALWARIAVKRYAHGDEAGALNALRRAATAPRYDVYWIDQVRLFERAFAATTGLSYAERTIAATGIVAATWRPNYKLVTICKGQIGASPEWLPACRDFGKRLEADSDVLLDTAVGVTIQAAVYEALGDRQQLATATRKREELSTAMTLEYLDDAALLLMRDASLLTDYLTEFDTYGELAAMQFLESEVARREALPGYDPCG